MTRPEVVYLETPIIIQGIAIRYTEAGCKYLIEHWQAILEITDDKRTDKAHIRKLIEQWNQYLELYQKQREQQASNADLK